MNNIKSEKVLKFEKVLRKDIECKELTIPEIQVWLSSITAITNQVCQRLLAVEDGLVTRLNDKKHQAMIKTILKKDADGKKLKIPEIQVWLGYLTASAKRLDCEMTQMDGRF